jgi:hypothetical protein
VLNIINEGVVYSPPSVSQRAALYAIQNKKQIQEKIINTFKERINYAYEEINKINFLSCKKPKGSIYTTEELKKCEPDSIEISSIPGTLRSNIMTNLAANKALSSVPKPTDSSCLNSATGKNYTYKELTEKYNAANNSDELVAASQLIKSCSALRVIPDALPAFKNEEALLASLNKLFNISGWEPESISPSANDVEEDLPDGLNGIAVNVSVEANSGTTMTVLHNIERSIREFNIESATIEWSGSDNLLLQARATAYYNDKAIITETKKTIREDS